MKKYLFVFLLALLSAATLISCTDDGDHACNFSDWVTVTGPSCTSEGKRIRSCECGETEVDSIPKIAHNVTRVEAKAPTCTESGYDEFEYCTECIYSTFTGAIPAAHTIERVGEKAPTCTSYGHPAYEYCTVCKAYTTYTELPPEGHSFEELACTVCDVRMTPIEIFDVSAATDGSVVAAYYELSDGTTLLDISGEGEIRDFEASSPWAKYKASLTHLKVGDGITRIGEAAFKDVHSLVSVTLGRDVAYIAHDAFLNCYRITEVINGSPLSIARDASNGYVGYYALYITTDSGSRVTAIGDYLFYVNKTNYTLVSYIGNDSEITLPVISEAKTYVVKAFAFYDLDFLTSVTVGEHVVYVPENAFLECDNLG